MIIITTFIRIQRQSNIRTNENYIMPMYDELTTIYHLLHKFSDFLLLGGSMLSKCFKVKEPRGEFTSTREKKERKKKCGKQNERTVRSRLVIGLSIRLYYM